MKPNHVYYDIKQYQSASPVKFYDSVGSAGIKLAVMAVIFCAVVLFILASPAHADTATYYCKTWYGATIPIEPRTPDNTQVYTADQCHSYIATSDSIASSSDPAGGTATVLATGRVLASPTFGIPSGIYYTPSGSYTVSHAGTATFIARASTSRR